VNRRTGQSKGYAFVEFEDRRDAEDAFERYQGYTIEGRRLRLDWDVGLTQKVPRKSPSSRRRSRSPRRRSPGTKGSHSPSPRRGSHSPSPRTRSSKSPSRTPPPQNGEGEKKRSRSPPRYRRRSPQRDERALRDSSSLFIGNLPYTFRDKDVAEYFERCGRVKSVVVGVNRRTGQSKGYAFVEFEDRRDAEDAFERYQGYTLEGRRLRLDWDVGLTQKGPRKSPSSRRRSRSPRRRSPGTKGSHSPSPRRGSRSPSPRRASKSPSRTPPPQNGEGEKKRSRSPAPLSPDKKQKIED